MRYRFAETARRIATPLVATALLACQDRAPIEVSGTEGSSTSSSTGTTLPAGATTMSATTQPPPTTSPPPSSTDADAGSDGTTTMPDDGSGTTGEVELGECQGQPLTGDVFEPSQIYLVGSVEPGACEADAIANVCAPDHGVWAFGCYFANWSATVRPTDGALLYQRSSDGPLWQFQCDNCPATSARELPDDPLANDLPLPTPGCEDVGGFFDFLVAPDGSYLFACNPNPNTWYGADGTLVWADPDGDHLQHLGHDGLALSKSAVIDLVAQTSTPIIGLRLNPPGPEWLTWRADPSGGFWVVVDQVAPELWHIGADGVAISEGVYPEPPEGYGPFLESALDPDAALVQIGWSPEPSIDVIVRRVLGGQSELIYSELNDPLVKIHISSLATGP